MRAPNLTLDLEERGPFRPSDMTVGRARARADAFWRDHGRMRAPRLLSATGKMLHDSRVVTLGITLRPGAASGLEVCTMRTAGCTAACVLETSFRGKDAGNRDSRTLKTLFLSADPQAFITLVAHELRLAVKRAAREGRDYVAFRPNVASDIRWELIAPALFGIPGVRGYDYTKWNPLRDRTALENYRLTYSVSEHPLSERIGAAYVAAGGNAAVVVNARKHEVPTSWAGVAAVDGDATDDRTRDPRGCYVLLSVKADGKADHTGFVKTIPLVAVA